MKSGILRRCLFIALIYLFTEGLIFGGLRLLERRGVVYDPNLAALTEDQKARLQQFVELGRGEHVEQHPVLGWVPTAEANSAGMRDDREYAPRPAPGVLRIAAFGDSFTYGEDVALEESWARQLSEMDSSLEILNYGVGAYGLDQAYLRYLEVGTEYAPQVVFIGYMSENIARNVNVFRPFYASGYRAIFTKPRFVVRDGELVLLENPVATRADHERLLHDDARVLRELGVHDHHYQSRYAAGSFDFLPSVRFAKILWQRIASTFVHPIFDVDGLYGTDSEAYEVTLAIFDGFYRKVLENGALPMILIFPDLNDQQRSRAQRKCRYEPLLEELEARGLRTLDLLPALIPYESKYEVSDLVVQWGHFSPLGSEILAGYILSSLRAIGLADVPGVEAAIEAERARLGRIARRDPKPARRGP